MTEDVVAFFNKQTGKNLTPIFDQYLRHAAIPVLELKFDEAAGTVDYRWKADEKVRDADPLRKQRKRPVGEMLKPTTQWQTLKTSIDRDSFSVPVDAYDINVSKAE